MSSQAASVHLLTSAAECGICRPELVHICDLIYLCSGVMTSAAKCGACRCELLHICELSIALFRCEVRHDVFAYFIKFSSASSGTSREDNDGQRSLPNPQLNHVFSWRNGLKVSGNVDIQKLSPVLHNTRQSYNYTLICAQPQTVLHKDEFTPGT